MAPTLTLRLLGPLEIEMDRESLTSQLLTKAQALLVYLALTGQPQPRTNLMVLLWGDSAEDAARMSLRQGLANLRAHLEPFLLVERQTVALRPEAAIRVDAVAFEQQLTHALAQGDVRGLESALALYRGELLSGFTVRNAPDFERWLYGEQERLRQLAVRGLERQATAQADAGNLEEAAEALRRALALEPWREETHRRLMEVLARAGQRSAALAHYATVVEALAEELGVEPSAETQTLYHEIQQNTMEKAVVQARRLPVAEAPPAASAPPFLTDSVLTEAAPSVFVGRERELDELATALATARRRTGQVLFVIGGAGRGKTRLAQEFARRAQATDPDLLAVSGHCNAHTGIGDPYLPFREALAMLAGEVEAKWAGGLISSASARRLWETMPVTLPALVEHGHDLIAAFLSAPALQTRASTFAAQDASWFRRLAELGDGDQSSRLDEKRLHTQYATTLKAIASQRPLLLILEDLHWIDAPSNGLLFHLSREIGDSPILILGTYRPDELSVGRRDERHPLSSTVSELKRQHGDIWLDLADLSTAEGRHFVDAYVDTQPNRLGESFRAALYQHTQGHALFTAELLRDLRERGILRRDDEGFWVEAEPLRWQALPSKVEGVIERRIGRLEEELQSALAVASVEGEIFTAEVVARVRRVPEHEVVERLSRELDRRHRLVTAESVERVGGQRLARYRFRHILFQHYLYHSLDATERAYLHEAVGRALEELYGEQAGQAAVQLAHHFEQAGVVEKAVAYLQRAGEQAYRVSANSEAIRHFSRALELLAELPDTRERAAQELALCIPLVNALGVVKGAAAAEVEVTLRRAYDLSRQLGDTRRLFSALHALQSLEAHRRGMGLDAAHAWAEEMLRLARSQPDPVLRVSAHHVLGNALVFQGEHALAREILEEGLRWYRPEDHRAYAELCNQDEGVAALANLSAALWHLGYPDQALRRAHQGYTLAQDLAHPFSVMTGLLFLISVCLSRREGQTAQQYADAMIRIATDQEFGLAMANAVWQRSTALLIQGRLEAGIAEQERALDHVRASGQASGGFSPPLHLAEAYGRSGQAEKGLALLEETHAELVQPLWEAEWHRVKGELLLIQAGNAAEPDALRAAEGCFEQAVEMARRQQSRSLELRAVTSLARLWQRQGKTAEARTQLAEIYGWFTEGFDTADLVEAKALLDALDAEQAD